MEFLSKTLFSRCKVVQFCKLLTSNKNKIRLVNVEETVKNIYIICLIFNQYKMYVKNPDQM